MTRSKQLARDLQAGLEWHHCQPEGRICQEQCSLHQGNASAVLSRYLDTYIRQGGQWLFQSRQYSFIYNGPADLSGTYTPL